ncbi:hypothetical protein [Kibdelosporangium aridum]|uniref:hypothetical protein n=1 Tax=Kibdelosporangium aridum TaxID=2030 RepID=UPI0035EEF4AA
MPEIGELVQVRLGPMRAYAVTSPRLLHQMMVTDHARFDKGRMYEKMRGWAGNGIGTSNGRFHRRQRR